MLFAFALEEVTSVVMSWSAGQYRGDTVACVRPPSLQADKGVGEMGT